MAKLKVLTVGAFVASKLRGRKGVILEVKQGFFLVKWDNGLETWDSYDRLVLLD